MDTQTQRPQSLQSLPMPNELWQHQRVSNPTPVRIVTCGDGVVFFRLLRRTGSDVFQWSIEQFLNSFERCGDQAGTEIQIKKQRSIVDQDYVAQEVRVTAQLAAATLDLAAALLAIVTHEDTARAEMAQNGYAPPELPWMGAARAALKKAGVLA